MMDKSKDSDCWNIYCDTLDEYYDGILEHVFPKAYEWPIIILYVITFIVGLVGNFLVVYAVWKNHNMRTVTNVFIVNLAVGDFLVILLCLPPTLIQDVSLTWFLGTTMCKIIVYMQNVSVSVSVLTLSAISVERWYAICHPLAFKSTLSRARNIIIVIWVVAASVAIPEVIVMEAHAYPWPDPFNTIWLTACTPSWDILKQAIYQLCLLIALYLIPLILMLVTYSNIVVVLRRSNIPGQVEMDGKCTNHDDRLQARRKAVRMLITIVVVFAVCYLPVHILNILRNFDVLPSDGNLVSVQASLSHWLPYLNSSLNPVIYNFMSAKFRKEFKLACYCCLRPLMKTRPRR